MLLTFQWLRDIITYPLRYLFVSRQALYILPVEQSTAVSADPRALGTRLQRIRAAGSQTTSAHERSTAAADIHGRCSFDAGTHAAVGAALFHSGNSDRDTKFSEDGHQWVDWSNYQLFSAVCTVSGEYNNHIRIRISAFPVARR